MSGVGGVFGLVVGIAGVIVAALVVNLIYSTISSSIPANSTPLFNIAAFTTAANLVPTLLVVIIAGAMLYYITNFGRGSE